MSDETCVRCGESGEDRRTLWMACFYAMDELPIPFEQCAIDGHYMRHVGNERVEPRNFTAPKFERTGGEPRQHRFFTLRVCKACRADWMGAIRRWYTERPEREETGTGVYLRRDGATVEATPDEVRSLIADKEAP